MEQFCFGQRHCRLLRLRCSLRVRALREGIARRWRMEQFCFGQRLRAKATAGYFDFAAPLRVRALREGVARLMANGAVLLRVNATAGYFDFAVDRATADSSAALRNDKQKYRQQDLRLHSLQDLRLHSLQNFGLHSLQDFRLHSLQDFRLHSLRNFRLHSLQSAQAASLRQVVSFGQAGSLRMTLYGAGRRTTMAKAKTKCGALRCVEAALAVLRRRSE